MLRRKWIAIIELDTKTWDETEIKSDEIDFAFSKPLVVKRREIVNEYYDGEKPVMDIKYEPVYGLLLSFYGKFEQKSQFKVLEYMQTWVWEFSWFPYSFIWQYPFFQRKPF